MDRALGIDMEAGGEAGPNVEVDVGGVVPGYEAKASSAKKLTFKVDTIPSLEACLAWGYLPQLGVDGCLPSRNCKAAAVEELRTALGDEKAIRLQAASDLSCIADSIQVNVLNFSGMSGTYEAAGCGKAARYTVNTTVVAPAGGGQPGPSTEKREVTKSPGIADNRE